MPVDESSPAHGSIITLGILLLMRKDDVSDLLQRYLSGHKGGKDAYFDADEIEFMLDSFEESDDYTYYDEVLALGLRLHPGNTELQIRQCRLYAYNEDYESALALIETIAETDNQDLDMLRLECYCSLDEYDKVQDYTKQLIKSECDYLETLFEYIAPILSDLDMTKEARDYIDLGLTLYPNNLILKDELCYNLEMEGDLDEAIRISNELIDKNPYSNEYWFTLGRLYSMRGEFDKAIEAFDFALTCDDSDPELKILKAYCLYMNENYEKAIEVYNEVASDESTRIRIKPLMAECYIKLEEYEKGYQLLKDLVGKETLADEPTAYINYIRCCAETERLKEASSMLRQAAERFPDNVRILSILALAYLEKGDEKHAMETTELLFNALDNSDDKQPEDFDSLFRAGQYLYMKGETEKALKYYKKVYEANPDMPYIHLHLAMAYLATGDMKHFGEHYNQTSPEELIEYLETSGLDFKKIKEELTGKHIPPEDLAKEFINNKDNSN